MAKKPSYRTPHAAMRNTKIVATLGPASDSEETIRALLEAGVDVFRLNASHGSQAEHGGRIRKVRAIAGELGLEAGVLLDLQGPKIRLGRFEGGAALLREGDWFTLTAEEVLGTAERASVSYPRLPEEVKPNDRILLADGTVELRVVDSSASSVRCRVVRGGAVSDRKGVNVPGVAIQAPSLTKKDMSDLRFGIEAGVDMVALSFVRRREDVVRLRLFLEEAEAPLPVIAKIEKPEGWHNFDEILEESDGVMVARGDLGVEMALERVPFIQKAIIERARRRGRFVITATQMLESMVDSAVPTRAEVSDVANAIYDGADAVMLSAETSTGRYPVEAARWMARIAAETDSLLRRQGLEPLPHSDPPAPPEIIADAASRAAGIAQPAAIAVLTTSGRTARLVARYRPPVPILAFTRSDRIVRQLSVVYGVRAFRAPLVESTDSVLAAVDELLQSKAGLGAGQTVILLAGLPIERMGPANILMLHRVGEIAAVRRA
jgi:pyruvate kinase